MGAGEVGKGLANGLVAEGHDITVLDINPSLLAEIETHEDVLTLQGNGAAIEMLQQAQSKQRICLSA